VARGLSGPLLYDLMQATTVGLCGPSLVYVCQASAAAAAAAHTSAKGDRQMDFSKIPAIDEPTFEI